MKFVTEARGTVAAILLTAGTTLALTSCASSDTTADSDLSATTAAADIPGDTPVGEESRRILDILNAAEDTTVEDWDGRLHDSFTAEVSAAQVVELLNQNLRPVQPFTVTGYEGGHRRAVTTLSSPVSEPLDMSLTLDADGLITGMFFGESSATD